MTEINWKDKLRLAWFGNFLTGVSISLVVPFIPIFVEKLGVGSERAAFYAGLAIFCICHIGCNGFSYLGDPC